MNRTNIDWPGLDCTWNPVVGCKRDCAYCYAKKMNNRYKWIPDWKTPVFYPERLEQPLKVKKPSKIFVGSMTDIAYWKDEWVESVLEVCENSDHHKFMFLSKSQYAYMNYDVPQNCLLGLTMTLMENAELQEEKAHIFTKENVLNKKFFSLEPLLGEIKSEWPIDVRMHFNHKDIEHIIVGAMTGPGAIKPEKGWIESIKKNIDSDKLYWKDNIKKYL